MRKNITVLCCLSVFLFINLAHGASVVTADHKGGYSALIMDEVLQYWSAQGQQEAPTRILLEIAGDGALENCLVLSSSGSKKADAMACNSAKKASPFMAPPHNFPTDVYMSFWTGKAKAAKKEGKKTTHTPKDKATTKPLLAHVVDEPQQASSKKAPADEANTDKTASAKKEGKAPTQAKKSTASTAQKPMTHAGIDYSRPRPTPSGLMPLGDLSDAKLPPSDEPLPENMEDSNTIGQDKQDKQEDDFVIKVRPDKDASLPASNREHEKAQTHESSELDGEKQEEDTPISEEPAQYAQGKEPFIQENRRGQVMDEVDYYVEKVIRKVRPLVEFPLGLKPGIVSASIIMNVQADGTITGVSLSSSSRYTALDEALVQACKKVSDLGPHPKGKAQELYLIFMVETPNP